MVVDLAEGAERAWPWGDGATEVRAATGSAYRTARTRALQAAAAWQALTDRGCADHLRPTTEA